MELEGSSSCPRPLPSKAEMSRGAYLAWEDLTVVIPNFSDGPTRRLLQRLNGYAEPGRIMAIMGPSGSGKSTLLDSLAGQFLLTFNSMHHTFRLTYLSWQFLYYWYF